MAGRWEHHIIDKKIVMWLQFTEFLTLGEACVLLEPTTKSEENEIRLAIRRLTSQGLAKYNPKKRAWSYVRPIPRPLVR